MRSLSAIGWALVWFGVEMYYGGDGRPDPREEETMFWLIAGFVAGCSLLGGYVSAAKHRPIFEGLLFGFLLGPLGVLIAALLPTAPERPVRLGANDRREEFIQHIDEKQDDALRGWLADDGLRGVRP
jgi:hypothetical protein